jgi:signal peptidase I
MSRAWLTRVSPFLQAGHRAKASADECKRQISADFGALPVHRRTGEACGQDCVNCVNFVSEQRPQMNESVPPATAETAAPESAGKKKEEGSFAAFLVKLVIAVVLFRTLLFTSFSIPSESMMPRLLVGDFLFASKWSYGYSGASLPIDWDSGKGKILGRLPERGDVVIFKHPLDRTDYVKRVIGLPGDTIQMVDGVLVLNGEPVRKQRLADFVLPIDADRGCGPGRSSFTVRDAGGSFTCRFPRYRETLPGGISYQVLDLGVTDVDNTEPQIVPEGMVFMMGDNRDNSQDSRRPAVPNGWVGLVPVENLVGRASFMFFSIDGSAEWFKPWTWFAATRWDRIGRAI